MTASPFTGRVLDERWEIGELFEQARADNSKLWTHLGRDRATGEQVLVNALRPALARDPAIRAEYAWGLDRIAGVAHPGVLRVLGHHIDDDAAELLFVSELLPWHSRTLARQLHEGAVYRETEVVAIGQLALAGLAAAHARGIAFGNVKTSNLLATRALDRVVHNGLPKPPFRFASIQQLGAYLGKPFACAPELIATGAFDARADIYGLGLVLYELVAGRLPFRASDNLGVFFTAIIEDELPPVRELAPDVSPRLAEVIARAVAKAPDARYQSATEMAAALAKAQPRAIAMLPRPRLAAMVATALPSPIAHAYAAIAVPLDDVGRLHRAVDAAQTCITFCASIVIAARARAKLDPVVPDAAARAQLSRPSLGHWLAIVREGTRSAPPGVPELADTMWVGGKPSAAARALDELVALRNDVRHGATPTGPAARRRLDEATALLERARRAPRPARAPLDRAAQARLHRRRLPVRGRRAARRRVAGAARGAAARRPAGVRRQGLRRDGGARVAAPVAPARRARQLPGVRGRRAVRVRVRIRRAHSLRVVAEGARAGDDRAVRRVPQAGPARLSA